MRSVTLVLAILGSAPASAASAVGLRMEAVSRSADMIERKLASLEREYGHRRGLIGAEAAESRFEDAVFAFLVEDYERAATVFYTLVEAEALVQPDLARDAEWYLAECLIEDGNMGTAVEAYQRIIDQGAGHPFFNDAVRRQLEAYGFLKDTPGFYRVYNRYIVTSIVPTTDEVRYSMAKSFYHQGDWTRAKALFAEIVPANPMYTRARYFLGAILVAQGQVVAAVPQFEMVINHAPPMKAEGYHGMGGIKEYAQMRAVETEVLELARLALGRIHYEIGEFDKAQRYYQDIRVESQHFAEQLYELVWVYVRQEHWLDAINQIEIFLIAFPDHHYAFQLHLLLGHLHMRRNAHERALATYEDVVKRYGPIQEHLAGLESNSTKPDEFFDALVSAQELEDVDPSIPVFAIDMLVEDEFVGRTVKVRREVNRQEGDIQYSRDLIEQIAPVLQKGTEGVGTFRQGRAAISAVRNDGIKLRADIVDFEISMLEDAGGTEDRRTLAELRNRWEVLVGRAGQVRSVETDASDRENAFSAQVREVQQLAFRSQQVALDQIAQLTGLKRRLRENIGGMSAGEIDELRRTIATVEETLRKDIQALERMQGDTVKRRVMRTVDTGVTVDTSAQRGLIADDLTGLRGDVIAARRRISVPDSATVYQTLEEMWRRGQRVERRSLSTLGKLERAERAELELMRRRLAKHVSAVAAIDSEVQGTSGVISLVSGQVTRAGLGRVEDDFHETVMGADRGIVDVYWARKVQVTDEIERLNEERGKRTDELNTRFELIRQRMGDSSNSESK
jgi:TolA-binding protein